MSIEALVIRPKNSPRGFPDEVATAAVITAFQYNVSIPDILRLTPKNMTANFSSQMGHLNRCLYPVFANCVHTQNDVGRKCSRLGEIS